jgi:hypothetical protein
MNESALPLTGRIGDPFEAVFDQLSGAGSAGFEIAGECGKGWIRHIVLPDGPKVSKASSYPRDWSASSGGPSTAPDQTQTSS